MTAEKYVKKILKNVHCSSAKKKDIQKQLLADMEERTSQGEALENVISQMGTVKEVADGFNENISPEEQKSYRRNRGLKIMALVVISIGVLAALVYWMLPKARSIEASSIFSKSQVESAVTETIAMLDDGDYEALQKKATSQMAEVLNADTMEAAKLQVGADWGEQTAAGTIYMQEIVQMNVHYAICQVNVAYENRSVTYTITFDKKMKLAGIYMK